MTASERAIVEIRALREADEAALKGKREWRKQRDMIYAAIVKARSPMEAANLITETILGPEPFYFWDEIEKIKCSNIA